MIIDLYLRFFEMTDNAKIAESMIDYTIQNLHNSPNISKSGSLLVFDVTGLSIFCYVSIYFTIKSLHIYVNSEGEVMSLKIECPSNEFDIILKKNDVRRYFYESEDFVNRAKYLYENFLNIVTGI